MASAAARTSSGLRRLLGRPRCLEIRPSTPQVRSALSSRSVCLRLTPRSWAAAAAVRVWTLLERRMDMSPALGAHAFANRVAKTAAVTRERQTPAAAEIWARIVSKAIQISKEHRELVGVKSFDLALQLRQSPVSPVIVVTFPVLHAGLPGKRKGMMFLGLLPLPYDIDKRKDARRALVEAFLSSTWRPGDLALAAHRAGVLPKIAGRLRAINRGDYLARVVQDLRSRNDALANTVADHVDRSAGISED